MATDFTSEARYTLVKRLSSSDAKDEISLYFCRTVTPLQLPDDGKEKPVSIVSCLMKQDRFYLTNIDGIRLSS